MPGKMAGMMKKEMGLLILKKFSTGRPKESQSLMATR